MPRATATSRRSGRAATPSCRAWWTAAVTHSANDGPSTGLGAGGRDARRLRATWRARRAARRALERGRARGARGFGARRLRRRGLPHLPQVGDRRPVLRAHACVVVNADEGRAGHDQGPLRHGAAAAPARSEGMAIAARFVDAEHAIIYLREEYATARARLLVGNRRVPRGRAARVDAGGDRHRRRLLRLRRGDGDARVAGGPPRHASPAPAVPGRVRLPRPADADQQRRDARAHPGHPAPRRRVVRRARR